MDFQTLTCAFWPLQGAIYYILQHDLTCVQYGAHLRPRTNGNQQPLNAFICIIVSRSIRFNVHSSDLFTIL